MVAALDYVAGQAQMFSYLQTPWHREGIVLEEGVGFDEALELVKFDYDLELHPCMRPVTHGADKVEWTEVGDAYYVLRPDKNVVLGTVGSRYTLVPNKEAFAPLKPLVDEGLLRIETGGVLRDGADAWLLGQWDLSKFGSAAQEVFNKQGDEILPYSVIAANHNGRRPILLGNTPTRIVCANTLGQAETSGRSHWEKIPHFADAGDRLVAAAEKMFSGVVERYEVIAQHYKLLQSCYLTKEEFGKLVLDLVQPDPRNNPKFNPDARRAESVLARADARRDRLKELWYTGKGHTGEPTAWYAYNAVAEAIDHDTELWPTRAGAWRTASLLDGKFAEDKQKVLNRLVRHAEKQLSV